MHRALRRKYATSSPARLDSDALPHPSASVWPPRTSRADQALAPEDWQIPHWRPSTCHRSILLLQPTINLLAVGVAAFHKQNWNLQQTAGERRQHRHSVVVIERHSSPIAHVQAG
eukprot:scaffold142650_cov32-Tisochrysis_lutea.AAC.3